LGLLINITLGRKKIPVKNILAYLPYSVSDEENGVMTLTPVACAIEKKITVIIFLYYIKLVFVG
jgi:hypothetical protein